MNEKELYKKFLEDLTNLMMRYSILKLKVSTLDFDRVFELDGNGELHLLSEKAVIRVQGHVTKVSIGEHEEFKTYTEAYESARAHWSAYHKQVRANRSPDQVATERKRQKAWYANKRRLELEKKSRQ